jgi:hypothetical protein
MNSNVLDLLLQADASKLVKPAKQVEIKRLSEAFGGKVIFTCEALTARQYDKVQDDVLKLDYKNKQADINVSDMQALTVIEGVKEPTLKSKELREKYGAPTPLDLLKKLLLPGEIQNLYNIIAGLSGFDNGAVEEVKNSSGQTEEQK